MRVAVVLLFLTFTLTSSAAVTWNVPSGITTAGTFQAILTTTSTNSMFTESIGAAGAQVVYGTNLFNLGISELEVAPSSPNFNFAIRFFIGPTASNIIVNVSDGTTLMKLSISYAVFVTADTPYMTTQSVYQSYSASSNVAAGSGRRVGEPGYFLTNLAMPEDHDIVVLHFLVGVFMNKAASSDYYINSQVRRYNTTHLASYYAVKDNTTLTAVASAVLILDRTAVVQNFSIFFDVQFRTIVNSTAAPFANQPFYNLLGRVAGINSYTFSGTEAPKFLFNMTNELSTTNTNLKFMNLTFLNVRVRDCAGDVYVPSTGTCEAGCPDTFYRVVVTGFDYCAPCAPPCTTCNPDGKTCLSCPSGAGFTLVSGTCSCPDGQYPNKTTSLCTSCDPSCFTCFGGGKDQCINCRPGLIVVGGRCQCQADGQFYNDSAETCQPCQLPCKTCFGAADFCIDCVSGTFKVQDLCLKCQAGQYFDNTTKNCQNCNTGCAVCNNNFTCQACRPPSYLNSSNFCVPCASNQYYDGTVCTPCDAGCPTCWMSPTNCTSCPLGKYLSLGGCWNCRTGCANCTDINACVSCTSPLILAGGICQTCPSGQYPDPGFGGCMDCALSCLTCLGNATNCTSCREPRILVGNQCPNCPNGTVWNSNEKKCIPCSSNCLQCWTTPNNCTACPSFTNLTSGQCISICPSGQYFEQNEGVCRGCPAGCTSCTNITFCTNCTSGLGLSLGQCVPCPANQFLNSATRACQSCQPGCATCPNGTNCSTCSPGFILSGGLCVPCPGGKYFDLGKLGCSDCPSICGNCSNPFTCTSCRPPKVLAASGVCVDCLSGYFFDNTTGTCLACESQCSTCSGAANRCLSCVSPTATVSWNNTCVTCAPEQYYNRTIASPICVACPSVCSTCLNSTYCLTCPPGMNMAAGNCQVCASNQFSLAGVCTACDATCVSCLTATVCTRCPPGKGLDANGACLTCNSTSFVSNATKMCTLCPKECLACSSPTMCTACVAPFALSGAACVPCRANQFYDATTSACTNCTTGCYFCNSSIACGRCMLGYQLSSGICIACTSQQYFNVSVMACQTCPPSCLTCSGPTTCTSCSSPRVLFGVQCQPCPIGQYYDAANNICSSCATNCMTCTSNVTCTLCQFPAVLVAGVCMTCPAGEYYDPGASSCAACSSPCVTCSSPTDCASCTPPLLLVAGLCQNCSAGQFFTAGACTNCSANCLTCTGTATSCTSCAPPRGLNAGACVSCLSTQYFSPLTGLCTNCPSGCPTCNSSTVCLSCVAPNVLSSGQCVPCPSDTFYNSTSKTCIGCSLNCLTCVDNSAKCLTCKPGAILSSNKCIPCPPNEYFDSGSSSCAACAAPCVGCVGTSTSCTVCNSTSVLVAGTCVTCPSGEYYDLTAASPGCVSCPATCGDCKNATYCFTCPPGMNLAGGRCQTCLSNEFTSGSACSACDANCASCIGSATNCTSCPASKILSSSGSCVDCPVGTYFEPLIRKCAACMKTCHTCADSLTCLSCNSNRSRTLTSGQCVCSAGSSENLMGQCISDTYCFPGFQHNGRECQEICGDGKVFVLPCDDGNNLDGDGCSAICQLEGNFSCRGGNSLNSTECSYNQPLKLSVKSILKDLTSNKVSILLKLLPALRQFKDVDFSKLVVTNLPIKRIICSYIEAVSYSNGKVGADSSGTLNITVEYSQNIQNTSCNITIKPPSDTASSFDMPPSAISFTVIPQNGGAFYYPETVFEGSNRNTALLKTCMGVGVFVLLISIVANQITGIETMHVLQVLFFSISIMGVLQPTLAGAAAFAGVNGYNALFTDIPSLMNFGTSPTTPILTTMGLGVRFLQNINIMLAFYLIIAFFGGMSYLLGIAIKSLASKFETIAKFMLCDLLLMLGAFNALNAGFSLGLELLWLNKPDPEPTSSLAGCVITILLSLAFNSLSTGLFFSRPAFFTSTKLQLKEDKLSQAEPIIQLCFRFLLGFLIGVLNSFTGAGIIAVVVQLAYLAYIAVRRPYVETIGNIRSILNHSIAAFVLIVSIIYNFTVVDGKSTASETLIEAEIWIVLILTVASAALVVFYLVKFIRNATGAKISINDLSNASAPEILKDDALGVAKQEGLMDEKDKGHFSSTHMLI